MLPDEFPLGDAKGQLFSSPSRLFENGRELGPAHSNHQEIAQLGQGRFSHWRNKIWMSSSDNSDPAENGRAYVAFVERLREVSSNASRVYRLISYKKRNGNCFVSDSPAHFSQGNTLEWPTISSLRLFEDGIELGPPAMSDEALSHSRRYLV